VAARLRLWRLRLDRAPSRTAHGVVAVAERLVVELTDGTHAGFGELAALPDPTYDNETLLLERVALEHYLLPRLTAPWPAAIAEALAPIRGHRAARCALSEAAWDLTARRHGEPLWQLLGGRPSPVPRGIALGIDEPEATLRAVEDAIAASHQRIKLKVSPASPLWLLAEVRARTPASVQLAADANGSFEALSDPTLRALDALGFDVIEQPLPPDDLVANAEAARRLATPVCLDESIRHPADLETLLALGARPWLNLKLARLGGYEPALDLLARARDEGLHCLVGGMYETAIGRAHALVLATLPGIDRPGDISASSRYGHAEPTQPLEPEPDGWFAPWSTPGIGRTLDHDGAELLVERALEA